MRPRLPVTAALVVWTVLVWTTRINNIWTDDALDTGARLGRTALALSFTGFALATGVALWSSRRATVGWLAPLVAAFALWTIGVWSVRSAGIVLGDHSAGFIVVHLVLAVVSVALAGLAVREARQAARTPTRLST
jgi:hypothetical protein